jgi:alpha-L-rhamnosidase
MVKKRPKQIHLRNSYTHLNSTKQKMLLKKLKYFIVSIAILLIPGACDPSLEENISVENLRCEMLVNPEGIDIRNPKLSWILQSEQRNIEQTAYQILAASSPEELDKNNGDLWNSGKINTAQSVHIPYEGINMESGMRCHWKVKVWSRNGESEWSNPAYWSMGLLHYKDWKGRWIGFDRPFPWDQVKKFSRLAARYFRKEFEIQSEKTIKQATVYVTGLGLYELYINGQRIGEQVLAPTPTDYTKNVKYNTFNVTNHIENGQNAIGTILGNGRYFTMRQNFKPYKIKNFGYPKMLLNLVIEYTDGSKQVIKSDSTWKGTADGPIRSNNEYDGEEYDARKEMPGWNNTGFDDSDWLNAEYVQETGGEYEAQMNENMKIKEIIHPVSISKLDKQRYILDMGQNMAGWLRIKVKGNRGEKVTLRFAESLQENGQLFIAPLRDAKATDIYTLKGEGIETWEPSFVYHGFRYVEISGFPGTPFLDNLEGCVVYDDMEDIGSFETSDSLINQVYQNAYWSIISNYKGMPIDCPQRNERMPWLGDRAIGCYGESFVVDNSKLYIKWLDDIRNSQKADGSISDVAPPYFRYYSDNMTWPGTYLFVADMLYKQYGLIQPIQEHYPYMKKWLYYMKDRYLMDYIMTKDSYGDWCAPQKTIEEGRGKSADVKKPSQLIATAYFFHFLQMMEDFAGLSANIQDIAEYDNLAEKVKEAFNSKFLNANGKSYGSNTLTDNLLPLYFGMVPKESKQNVLQNIADIILIENNGHLSVGLVGIQWLMRSLAENGLEDITFKLATNTTYPSWGYMVENGATTLWELWNANTAAPDMNSQNHVMLMGDLLIWYYENLAGIKSSYLEPGFKKVIMAPEFDIGLNYVKASYQSIYGLISSNWTKEEGKITWNISIPANTKAIVHIPAPGKENLVENGNKIAASYGLKYLGKQHGKLLFEVASGEYNFEFQVSNHEDL